MADKPNGKPKLSRKNLDSGPLETQRPGDRIATGEEQLGLLGADRHHGHDRHSGLDGRPDVSGAPGEVDHVRGEGGPVRVVVTTGKHQHQRARSQGLGGVVPARLDDSAAAEPVTDVAHEDAVVGERVHRPVESELLVEGGREDEDVGGEHAAGVVGHHQRAPS